SEPSSTVVSVVGAPPGVADAWRSCGSAVPDGVGPDEERACGPTAYGTEPVGAAGPGSVRGACVTGGALITGGTGGMVAEAGGRAGEGRVPRMLSRSGPMSASRMNPLSIILSRR